MSPHAEYLLSKIVEAVWHVSPGSDEEKRSILRVIEPYQNIITDMVEKVFSSGITGAQRIFMLNEAATDAGTKVLGDLIKGGYSEAVAETVFRAIINSSRDEYTRAYMVLGPDYQPPPPPKTKG